MSDDRLQRAAALLATAFAEYHWIFGKGRTEPSEPLYGLAIFGRGEEEPVIESENEDPLTCVEDAVEALENTKYH